MAPGKSGWTLWQLDPGGGEARASPLENVLRFDWYLDSRRVLYIKALEEGGRVGLFAADLASDEEVQLLDARSAELDVSPDGTGVTYVESASPFGMNLYLLTLEPPTASGLPRPVGKPAPLTDGGGVWHVHGGGWTPDGNALVYTRDVDHGDLYVLGPEPE